MIDLERPDFSNSPVASGHPVFHYRPADVELTPVVSVITPYFDTDEVFFETAQSLLSQSFQNFEWIIVDDGSQDPAALARLHHVQAGDPRIKVITQANAGPAAARNTAFRHSSGRYLCLLDSDDLLEATFIEKCVWFLESNPEFGFCNTWSVVFGDENMLWPLGFERGKAHVDANSGPPMSVICRAAYQACGGFDESIRFGHEDWDFWLAMAKAGFWGHTLPEYQAWYRKRTGGRFHEIMKSTSTHREFETFIANKYVDLKEHFPTPTIRDPEPYETIPTDLPFANLIVRGSTRRRVLCLFPWMVTGGADKVNLDWVKALVEEGAGVSICATLSTHHNWWHEFARLTPDIFVLPNFLRTADYPRFLQYLIESRQIDVVLISGSTVGYHLLPYLRTVCPAVTFVDLCHVEEPHWMSGGHPRFGAGYQDMLDLNLVTTTHLRDWMVSMGACAERIAVCHTGVDVEQLTKASANRERIHEKLGLPRGVPVIAFAGRLCEQKRPDFLADILHVLAERDVQFQTLVVGDGELRSEFESLLNRLGLFSKVRLMGTLSHAEWLEVLSVADIFLLPSRYEGISVALQEAMGMGVVPVTGSVGGQAEIIAEGCGYLIAQGPGEREAYADALCKLINDPAFRLNMSAAAREHISEHFSHNAAIHRFHAALDRAVMLHHEVPRLAVTPAFARELAAMAIEYLRVATMASNYWALTRHRGPAPANSIHAARYSILVRRVGAMIRNTSLGRTIGSRPGPQRYWHALLHWVDGRVSRVTRG